MATERQQRDNDRQSDLAVMDANEYKQKRRLERILDNLEAVQDNADEAWARYVKGEIDRDARNITIQRAVQNSIDECYKLLKDHEREVNGNDDYFVGDPDNPIGAIDVGDGTPIIIQGLKDYLEAPTFQTTTYEETVPRRNMPDETVTRTVDVSMPEWVSYRAFRRLKMFLDDVHDMEISFEEMDDNLPNWGFEADEDIPEDAVVL